jgi:hypothetical protein
MVLNVSSVFVSDMRAILACFVFSLALCVGCSKDPPPLVRDETPPLNVAPDPGQPAPFIEPMFPKVDPPKSTADIEKPADTEETTEENAPAGLAVPEEATGVFVESFKKYAAEVIPLPPIDDLTVQVDEYITKLETALEDLDGSPKYMEDAANVVRDAGALSAVVRAIGLAEADSKYKKSASAIIAATKTLAAAENLETGQKAYDTLKSALTSTDAGKPLSWSEKTADFVPLNRAITNLSATVKRQTDTERKLTIQLERKPQQVYGMLAALAAISQGLIPNASETSKPDAVEEWKKHCEEFRDIALKANALAHQFAEGKADYTAYKAVAIDAMAESCENCHKVFYPSAVGKK